MKKIIAVVLIAVIAFVVVRAVKLKREKEVSLPPAKEYAVIVKKMKIEQGDITLTLPALAQVRSEEEVNIASKIATRLIDVAKEGSVIKRGERIALLDDTDIKTKLESTLANIAATKEALRAKSVALENAKRAYERAKKLFAVKGVSKEALEQLETKVALLKSSIASFQAKLVSLKKSTKGLTNLLTYTTIKAPFDGVVSKRFLNPSDMAMPGRPIVTLTSLKGAYLTLQLPKELQPKGCLYKGRFFHLIPLHHTFNGLLEYRSKEHLEGVSAKEIVDVKVVLFQGKGNFLPKDTLLDSESKEYVLILDGKGVKPKKVRVVARGSEGVVVADELDGKEVVVAKPDILLRLLSGVPVKIKE